MTRFPALDRARLREALNRAREGALPRQDFAVWCLLVAEADAKGCYPHTQADAAKALGVSDSSISRALERLRSAGMVERVGPPHACVYRAL